MPNGVIIHLDNDYAKVLEPSKHFFDQLGIPLEYVCCKDVEEFNQKVAEHRDSLKAVVFDLLEKEGEIKDYKKSPFNEAIASTFKQFNVPVFIYSGYLVGFNEFSYNGTVIKIDKGNGDGFKAVADKIQLFHDSGFLDIFCPNGLLEQLLHKELHEAFIRQFSNESDIENIILAVKASGQDITTRIKDIFSRIALRSLVSNLMIDNTVAVGFNESLINAVEHYIRRLNIVNVPFWTGDVFEKKDKSESLLILTPRCDLATKGKEVLLACRILETEFSKKNAIEFIRDNIKEKKFRYLPKTPTFTGGKIDLSDHVVIPSSIVKSDFEYIISLSDDLTNEILGKFCAYLLRTSIPEVNEKELIEFLK